MNNFEVQIILHLRSLGLNAEDHTVTEEEIKSKYKKLAILYHPDRQNLIDDSKMKEINEAREFLLKNLNEVNSFILAGSPKARFEAEERERSAKEEEARRRAEEQRNREEAEEKKRRKEAEERAKKERERKEKEAEERKIREEAERKERERAEKEAAKRRAEQKRLEEERYIASLPRRAAEKYKSLNSDSEKERFKRERMMRKKTVKRVAVISLITAAITAIAVISSVSIASSVAKKKDAYNKGLELYENGNYAGAEEYFDKAGGYEDAEEYLAQARAYKLVDTDPRAAALAFGRIGTADALAKSRELFWDNSYASSSVTMGDYHHAVLTRSGTVKYSYTGTDAYASLEEELSEWKDIAYITSNNYVVAGVTRSGSVLVEGWQTYSLKKDTKNWTNIVAVYLCSDNQLIGLCADGTVKTTTKKGMFAEMREWQGICDIDVTSFEYVDVHDTHFKELVIAADIDGRVHLAGPADNSFSNEILGDAASWNDIIAVSISDARYIGTHIVGLKADGRVVASGTDENNVCDVESWENVIDIHSTSTYTFGITEDGAVLLAGSDAFSKKSVEDIEGAACFADIENLLVLDHYGYFMCEDGRETFFSKWNGLPHVPNFTENK